jgi:hypothetical protein
VAGCLVQSGEEMIMIIACKTKFKLLWVGPKRCRKKKLFVQSCFKCQKHKIGISLLKMEGLWTTAFKICCESPLMSSPLAKPDGHSSLCISNPSGRKILCEITLQNKKNGINRMSCNHNLEYP